MKQVLRETWRGNPWLVALIGFTLLTVVTGRVLVYRHGQSPEMYRAPEKVRQRVLLADVQLWGGLFLLGMTFWRRSRKTSENPEGIEYRHGL